VQSNVSSDNSPRQAWHMKSMEFLQEGAYPSKKAPMEIHTNEHIVEHLKTLIATIDKLQKDFNDLQA
jgi:hypothetical protein